MKKIILAISLFFLISLIFFPQIAATTFGKRLFLQAVQSRTHMNVTAKELSLTWLGPQKFTNLTFDSDALKGSIEEVRIGVRLWSLLPLFELKDFNQINSDIKIVNGAFQFDSKQFSEVRIDSIQTNVQIHEGGMNFTSDGKATQNEMSGTFTLQGQIRNIDQDLPDFSVHGEWLSFPTLPIARIIGMRYEIDENSLLELLGATFDLQGSASYSNEEGQFELSLHSPNIDSTIQGGIKNRECTLRQPLTASIHLTPELSQWILRDMNPLFVTGLEAKSPVRLRIEPSGFHCSIFPFELKKLQIGNGVLDLGQLRCSNGGSLASLMNLLKSTPISSSRGMDLWFTPLFFNVHEGLLETSRVDFLIDQKIHICTWGTINYLNNQLDMFVGLPAETLEQSFGIQKLPDAYVMKIALTGTMKKPKLATHAAAAKITALLAAQKSSHNWLSSGVFSLFGGVDSSVPPPNRPFPWEK